MDRFLICCTTNVCIHQYGCGTINKFHSQTVMGVAVGGVIYRSLELIIERNSELVAFLSLESAFIVYAQTIIIDCMCAKTNLELSKSCCLVGYDSVD